MLAACCTLARHAKSRACTFHHTLKNYIKAAVSPQAQLSATSHKQVVEVGAHLQQMQENQNSFTVTDCIAVLRASPHLDILHVFDRAVL